MEESIQDTAQEVVYRRGLVLALIMFVHLKFFVQIVLDKELLVFDLMLYSLLLFCVDYKRIRYSFFVLIPMAAVSLINPAARNMFVIFLMTYIVSKLPLRTVLWYNLVSQTLVFCLAAISLLLGVTESVMFEQTALDMRIRYDFGMGNPNTFSLFIYSILINLYLYAGVRNKTVMWILLAITLAVAKYTGSRTFLVAMLFLILCNMIRNKLESWPRFSRIVYFSMPLILIGAIFFFSLNYRTFPLVNILFTGRFQLYNALITSVSPVQALVGSRLVNDMTIDNSFLHLVYGGGLIALGVFFYLYYNAMFHSDRKDMSILLPLFTSVFMVGLTESILTFALLFGNMIVWVILYKIYMGDSLSEMLEPQYEEDSSLPPVQ